MKEETQTQQEEKLINKLFDLLESDDIFIDNSYEERAIVNKNCKIQNYEILAIEEHKDIFTVVYCYNDNYEAIDIPRSKISNYFNKAYERLNSKSNTTEVEEIEQQKEIKTEAQQEQAEQPKDDYYTRKHDKGKAKLLQVPVEAIQAISEIMDYGSNKYGANTWQQVEIERYLQAGVRHIYAIQEKDEQGRITFNLGKKDEESGIEHLKHALCNLAYAVALYEMKKADNEK